MSFKGLNPSMTTRVLQPDSDDMVWDFSYGCDKPGYAIQFKCSTQTTQNTLFADWTSQGLVWGLACE